MRSWRILLIEQDEALATKLAVALKEAGYDVVTAGAALEGLKKLHEAHYDLVIMAQKLPMLNGEDPCLRVRQASYLPIMVLGSEEEAAETLELGVDAYMAKPPNLRELIARVRSLLRRRERYYPPGGNSGVEISGSLAGRGDCPNGLTRTEFRLASCLACNRGMLVSYCRLIDEVWGGKAISLDTLHFFIRRLRSKFGGSAIFGIRGVGYCFKDTTG